MLYVFSSVVPVMAVAIIIFAFLRKVNVYSEFGEGVRNGVHSVVSVFPSLFSLFIAVSVFKGSGLADFLTGLLSPVTEALHFPGELVSFALLRPVSGSGSLALASNLFSEFGPDSFIGRAASVMMGSTETTFYTVTLYFGACGVKNIRHTLKCALLADLFSMIMSIAITNWYW